MVEAVLGMSAGPPAKPTTSLCTGAEPSCLGEERLHGDDSAWYDNCTCMWDPNKAAVEAYKEMSVEVLPAAGGERQRHRARRETRAHPQPVPAGTQAWARVAVISWTRSGPS